MKVARSGNPADRGKQFNSSSADHSGDKNPRKKTMLNSIVHKLHKQTTSPRPSEVPRSVPATKGTGAAAFQVETFIFQVQTSNGKWFHYPPGAEIKISEAFKKGKEKAKVTVLVGPDSRKEMHCIHFTTMKQMCLPENTKSRPIRMAVDLMLADKWGGNAAHDARIPPALGQDPANTPTSPNMYFPLFPQCDPLDTSTFTTEKSLRQAFKEEKLSMARAKRYQALMERARKIGAKKMIPEIEQAFTLCQHMEKVYSGLDYAALERSVRDCKQSGMKGPLMSGAKSRLAEIRVANTRLANWSRVMKAGCSDLTGYSVTALREMEREVTSRDAKTAEESDLLRARALRIDKALRDLEGRNGKTPLPKQTMQGPPSPRHAVEQSVAQVPTHWTSVSSTPSANGMLTAVSKSSPSYKLFRTVLETDRPTELNKGKDVKEKGEYSSLDLVGVWRVENVATWERYDKERNNIRAMFKRRNIKAPHFFMRRRLYEAVRDLPGYRDMYEDVNETYLIHGTGPDAVLPIVRNGMAPPHWECKALFGKGIYFAEDSCKNDQYGIGDWKLGAHPELHKVLFPPENAEFEFPKPPYKAYYVLLCRVIVGYFVTVTCTDANDRAMINNFHEGHPIFADNTERELAMIPGIDNPPIRYHCLVAKKGGAIVRFREFCQFHGSRVYPEYLLCYTRK